MFQPHKLKIKISAKCSMIISNSSIQLILVTCLVLVYMIMFNKFVIELEFDVYLDMIMFN